MKPLLHFMGLKAIACIVERVYDQGCWMFIDRSGPTACIEMVSPLLSSQSSDITDILTSNESDSDSVSLSKVSSMSVSLPTNGNLMNLDASSVGSLR